MPYASLLFGLAAIVAGILLIVFRERLAKRDSSGKDNFFGRKQDLAKSDTSTMWITIGGVVAIAIGVAAVVQAFL